MPEPTIDLAPIIENSVLHINRMLWNLHDPELIAVFGLGASITKPMRIVYFNNELASMFSEMEAERIRLENIANELKKKKRGRRRKK